MRKITRLSVVILFLLVIGLVSCGNDYGKKVKIEGTKGEVFYKEGISENEARKVGEILKEGDFFGNEIAASVQVAKENGDYTVRFVYDQDYYEKHQGFEKDFRGYAVKISNGVFDGKKVNITLADTLFKDFKRFPFEQTGEKPVETIDTGLAPAAPPAGLAEKEKDEFDHDSQGGVNFYWKGISDQESKRIVDYITENGAFAGGTAEIYMTKEGDRYILQFPVKKEYRNNAEIIAEVEKVSRQIKENVFTNSPYSFQMTDEKLNAIKSFDY